ncbi:nucleoside-diphosphate kinase [Alteribacillus iranensis]|uniref:Uncharacterized protein n=1 Tax=Alteribacillus iranensis TaxID=930128 RepID=A0A1I1ZWH0_9BACI|nr:hypothetical protein [Alteribacillus iranensis]SFE36005.1 hypothetical protein SAMN05192532_101490 [Alteribacillus iranensis]
MKAYRRKFYYLGANHRRMEPMSMDRIRQAGFDIVIVKEDLPYFISFCREWRTFFENEARNMHPLYRPYIEEASVFFDEQIEQMTLCTSPQYDSPSYILPLTELVSALMHAYNAFDKVLDAYQSMPAHFETALKYNRQFNVHSDVDKSQFILNHLPDLRLSIE